MKRKSLTILATLFIVAQAAWAQGTAMNEEALRTLVNESSTVKLGGDFTLTAGRLVIDGRTVTLDLNGHTLRRALGDAAGDGQVIFVQNGAKLTITDSQTGGKITGGWAYVGGGIYVSEGCELTIKGGTITGNTATREGGGIYVAGSESNINMQGNPVVRDNTGDDLYLAKNQLINVTGAFTEGAYIGVNPEKKQRVFTSGYGTYNSTAPSTYFFVDGNTTSDRISLNDGEAFIGSWDGFGTLSDPFLIKSKDDWKTLSEGSATDSYAGLYFRQTVDIDQVEEMVGTKDAPFAGIYDGDGHELGVWILSDDAFTAPFHYVCGATIRHLHIIGLVKGILHTSGLVGACEGRADGQIPTNIIEDCRVSANVCERRHDGGLYAGGFIGHGSEACNKLSDCLFDGMISVEYHNDGSYAAPFIGWSHYTTKDRQTITNCLEQGTYEGYNNVALYYACTPSDGSTDYEITLDRCYRTSGMSKAQGTFVFDGVTMSDELCSYKFVSDPTVQFGGKHYWTNGAIIETYVPNGFAFDHWHIDMNYGMFVSDCFTKNGRHQLLDVQGPPILSISNTPIPDPECIRTIDGITYRYLSRCDYHFFISDEERIAQGWVFENDDASDKKANLVKKVGNKQAEITAITGYDHDNPNTTFNGLTGVWIQNDLVGDWRTYSHVGIIAPHAFKDCTAMEHLYFMDSDANNYDALTNFMFSIGEGAFEGCTNLKEVKFVQYTTDGTNHWDGLAPHQVSSIASDAFAGCSQMKISVHPEAYRSFLASDTWRPWRSRIQINEFSSADFTVDGVKYRWFRDYQDLEALKNDDSGKSQMMKQIGTWSGNYQQFSAASLLDTKDGCNVYYTSVVGIDDEDIDDENGLVRIYNDPGSYYNYKTINLQSGALAGNTHVKAIEFHQTNGNSSNSYSDLKFVIPNGAFAGCTNLKVLRLFYKVTDGTDHWETLGPKDVIPGDNIFGRPDYEQLRDATSFDEMTQRLGAIGTTGSVPKDFKIQVSPNLYQDFLDDPNWAPYIAYIQPVDYDPLGERSDFTKDGLTYGYITAPGGIMQTSQVVSQDVSWWTAPRIAIEVAIMLASLASSTSITSSSTKALSAEVESARLAFETAAQNEAYIKGSSTLLPQVEQFLLQGGGTEDLVAVYAFYGRQSYAADIFKNIFIKETLLRNGFLTAEGVPTETFVSEFLGMLSRMNGELGVNMCQVLSEAVTEGIKIATQRTLEAKMLYNRALTAILKAAERDLLKTKLLEIGAYSAAVTTQAQYATAGWGGTGYYNGDALQKGMRANILSNIHQVGLVGGGYVITTPSKNLLYHTYIKNVSGNHENVVIYAGFDNDGNSTTSNITMTFAKDAFRNKVNLKTVRFHANEGQTSNASMPMLLTIPDSAFVGCTNLSELNLLLMDNDGGTRALGPENFVLAGDNIFAGLDPEYFHIVIDESRRQDFLDNESWAPLAKYFTYSNAQPVTQYREYGANYAYAYEQNSIKKENKVSGHLIEHTIVTGMDEVDYYGFAQRHQGAVKLCNDIGTYNNYQLDYVARKAFYGNSMLRTVSFTDLMGWAGIGDSYSSLDITLQDSCFADCRNLVNIDLVYMKTDGTNELQALTPQQVKVGKGILDGTTARIKMMPQQVSWFEADSTWAVYKDRFMPCIIRKTDEAVYEALKDMRYYDPAATGTDDDYWDNYIDLARIAGIGFSWLDGRFTNNGNIRSFADFKQFESVGLDYVGDQWFYGCTNLSNIVLPSTIKRIGDNAFSSCTSLTEIEIPASVTAIRQGAFAGATALNTIIVRGETPATLVGLEQFDAHDGLKIYVPATKVDAYKQAWSDYAQYIVSIDSNPKVTHITTTAVGQVADKLGLTPVKENSKIRYLQGNYAKYDSLTVSGPLNGDDIAVLRHLMGANAWESEFTDGQLRYLNLWNAELKRDDDHSYNGYGVDEYLEKDNWVGEYMFHNCNALESVVLPASVTEIGENTFQDATSLKRIAVGSNTTKYTRDLLQNLNGIEELVFLTDQFASSESDDPWEANIQVVYVPQAQLADYMSDPRLTQRTQSVMSVFEDDAVLRALTDKEHYFPSEYLGLESVKGIFAGNTSIRSFDEFRYFQNVRTLEDGVFRGCTVMERIAIPDSVKTIGSNVFRQCYQLSDIYISTDSIPTIADDAFDFQVNWFHDDFRIYVPKDLCKRYREAWPQYAQYINVDDNRYTDDEIITITVTEKNTLAQALGLTVTTDNRNPFTNRGETIEYITSARGDYSQYKKLKIVGPLSGADFSILRYLAGFCPWTNTRNYMGKLEYLDLYDATLEHSSWDVAPDCWLTVTHNNSTVFVGNDTLPSYALLQAYSLKTLILPKTCTTVQSRALQECEALEVCVIGDKTTDFNWDSFDDDAMLTRLYILTEDKLQLTDDHWIVQMVDNNYSPTFDAFYVRPSLLDKYLADDKYTRNRTRTNLISAGEFDDDESFAAFAAHAAATQDDLFDVEDVSGWFSNRTGIRNLTPLAYTAVDTLKRADFEQLTALEKITLPVTLEVMEDNLFSNAKNLSYVDMLMCDSTNVIDDVKKRGLARLGIDSLQTLVYLPKTYGTSTGTNIVVADGSELYAKKFRLIDSRDYCVPYAFETGSVENSRALVGKGRVFSAMLPYGLTLDTSKAKAYRPTDSNGSMLTMTEVADGTMNALMPYVVRLVDKTATLNHDGDASIPASSGVLASAANEWRLAGYTMRGTLSRIDNKTATEQELFMLVDGQWQKVPANNGNAYIAPFRAYLLENSFSGARSLGMTFEDVDLTGVSTLRLVDSDGTERYYDLNGRQLDGKPEKGIYIYNGKKYSSK